MNLLAPRHHPNELPNMNQLQNPILSFNEPACMNQSNVQQQGNFPSVRDVSINAGPGAVLDCDDEFFHVTCHVDNNLKQKIQCGDFVELEKLLPKTRSRPGSENKMDLVFREGHSYFVSTASESKITGIRRWEQAFRIYAAIYSEANPAR